MQQDMVLCQMSGPEQLLESNAAFKQLKALSLSSSLAQQPLFLRSYLNHGFFTSLVEKPGVPPTMHWSRGSQTAQG